eukprot:TRINITY_DN12217_c0_g1_i1.p1 TRINITY_DN12217_c0_g1~~TRINITY_DN12217_c0_g1_i1.p1  ORF type:complete len:102 (+),score=13.43 TRINITY_DN12217_c0_g1_i1:193-498(+)
MWFWIIVQKNLNLMSTNRINKVVTQPINLLFRYLQNKTRIQIWLYDNNKMRIEGELSGFDEFMNVVLDNSEEVYPKENLRKKLGRIMLKGDSIVLILPTNN